MYSITSGAGRAAKHGCSLGLGGGGEGGVAHHNQLGAVVGSSRQLLECGVVHKCQAVQVDGVFPGQLLQDHCLPQGWMGSQGPLRRVDHIPGGLENQVFVTALWNCPEVRDVRGGRLDDQGGNR